MRVYFLLILITVLILSAACSNGDDEDRIDPIVGTSPPSQTSSQPATSPPETPPPSLSPPAGLVQARVVRVVDGDTIEVDRAFDGRATVRYIGIDTPETVAPGQPVGCFGPEASAKNKELVEGKTVYLEKDVSETDRFGRLLRYVYLEDGSMVNERLVSKGYAQVSTFPPDVKYQERFLAAQTQAREASRGLWGPVCSSPPPPAGPTQPPSQGANCSTSYPTVCIPPLPPDLDCGDIPHRRFQVLPPDPHRFDADNDGIGCESG